MIFLGILDEVLAPEEVEEESVAEQVMHLEEVALQESEEIPVFENQEEVLEIESEALNKHLYAEKGLYGNQVDERA